MKDDMQEWQRRQRALEEEVSRRKRIEGALEEQVKERTAKLGKTLAELEAFSYSLAHDMRGPLRTIYGFTNLALSQYGDSLGAPATELLQRVIAASERMDRLIQDVLSLSHLSREEMNVTAVDVDKLLQEIVLQCPELQSPHAEVLVIRPLFAMQGDQVSLTQCLTNLLSNAVKFVARGVKPTVRVWSELMDPVAAGAASHLCPEPENQPVHTSGPDRLAGAKVRLWVEDNGIGIKPGEQDRIFEPFYRLHRRETYEGTGLGLAIVRKAVERMGGEVGVESEPGQGSRFWLQLPRANLRRF